MSTGLTGIDERTRDDYRRDVRIHFSVVRDTDHAGNGHPATICDLTQGDVTTVLGLTDGRKELGDAHPCACGGTIEVYGGAGSTPCARCKGCGALWTELSIIAAA
jgi:hypothetical protein